LPAWCSGRMMRIKMDGSRNDTEDEPPNAPATDRILLIACGALAREILALKAANNWTHLELTCLPADLHLRPERIPDAVEEAVTKHRDAYSDVFVVYADCGTGGLLQARCEALGVQMVPGAHCYAFFEGVEAFNAKADEE